jgi:hypothetical protein
LIAAQIDNEIPMERNTLHVRPLIAGSVAGVRAGAAALLPSSRQSLPGAKFCPLNVLKVR